MADRHQHRAAYIEAWYVQDADKLIQHTRDDFIFDDPCEPAAVTRSQLHGYMQRWNKRMRTAGGDNQWLLSDEVREDKNGILTDWEWWEVIGTGIKGMALIKTGDTGVFLERISYFQRR